MEAIKTRAIQRIVTELTYGGQIAMPIIEAAIEDALYELYEKTEMVKIELTPIDEVLDQKEYTVPACSGRICRICDLYQMSYDAEGNEVSRSAINPAFFDVGIKTDGTASVGSIEVVIALASKSTRSYAGGLLPVAVMAFGIEDYVPGMHITDASIAVTAKAMQLLAENTGKPWSDARKALAEESIFSNAVARIRYKAMRGNTGRGLKMNCTSNFL